MLFLTTLIIEILVWAEVDIFVPSFPELQNVFSVTPFLVELTLGVNLTAHCIFSLFAGNLGDRYGKRPVILLGIILFIIGTILCIFAQEFWVLLCGRMLQGLGMAGPAVMAYVVIADSYSLSDQKRLIGMINGVVTFAMALAPVVGSYISLFFGWRGNFSFLFILAIISFALSYIYIPQDKKNPKISLSLSEYLPVLKSKKALQYLITTALLSQPYWIFVATSPILYMEALGVSLKDFGLYQGILSIFFASLSFTSGYFFRKFGEKNCFKFSLLLMAIYSICVLLIMILNVTSPLIITLTTILMSAAAVFPLNILWPLCVDSIPGAKGKITALSVASRLILTSITVQITSFLYDGSYFYIGLVIILAVLANFWSIHKLFKIDKTIF